MLYYHSFRGLEPDEKVVAEATAKLDEKLNGYEVTLQKYRFLGGDVGHASLLQ